MSQNPYKGVRGGDPRLREKAYKALVSIEYICLKCNQTKSEKFPEGKDLTGRVCVDCRNAEGAAKNKARQEEMALLLADRQRALRNMPIRTKEEKLALLEEWKNAPKETCNACHKESLIADGAMPFFGDSPQRPNSIRTVMYVSDPFDYEVYGQTNMKWLCGSCYNEIEMDI